METEALEGLGLTKKESILYIFLLELGSCSATQLIRKSGLHRAVVYDLIERLIEKGLASFVLKGRKKHFEPVNPQRLIEMQKQKEEKLKEILPYLQELSKFTSRLEVKIYKGKEGLKAVFDDLISSGTKEWLVLGSSGKTIDLLPSYLEQFQKRRVKLGIYAKGLFINNISGKLRGENLKKIKNTEIRYLPKNISAPTVIQIYLDKTVVYSNGSEPPFAIVIENKDISNSFKEYFNALWKISSI